MSHSNVKLVPLIWFPLYCRREYIRLGSEQDPAWRDFPQALTETGGAQHYVTLFEAPFQASVLSDSENNALWASSLMAIPPLPPGSQPLARYATVDLMGNNLTQWASDVQEVASYMWWPPEAAVRCPIVDMIGVLNRLEGLAGVRYCWSCFGISSACQCSAAPRQVSGPMAALWALPSLSYTAMVSSTETTASTSMAGATSSSHSLPQDPLGEPMDTSSPLTTENLLATAGDRWRRPGPQTTGPAEQANSSWSPSDETSDTSTASVYPRRAGNEAGNTLPTTGVPP